MRKLPFQKEREEVEVWNKKATKGGTYSLLLTGIVLAILVLVNVLVSALPSNLTRFDISATKLYSITSNTKAVVNGLSEDVTIYWIVQAGEEDPVIEHLLSKYEAQSGKIEVVKKNPDIYPTFAQSYTSEEVMNNSLVVECGERNRFIGYDDIYVSELNAYTYDYDTSFDGEGALTSAIDYVTEEEQPKLYLLEGHGEMSLSEAFTSQLKKQNIETVNFSLLTENGVPEEADCVLINGPSSDISEKEKEMLSEYTKEGGKLMVLAGPTEEGTLQNLYSLIEEYGVETVEGVTVELDPNYYAFDAPYILLPEIADTELTGSLVEKGYYVIMPLSQAMITGENENVTPLLNTSSSSFSKADGYGLTTYEKEEKDTDGPFTLAVSIACENDGEIIWFGSSDLLHDTYHAYSSGANTELGMSAITALMGENKNIAISSKSLNYDYLTIADSTASFLKVFMIGICPLLCLGTGIVIFVRRRRVNETI